MIGQLNIFIAHGHNDEIRQELVEILESITDIKIQVSRLSDKLIVGESISNSYERLSIQCDLAIVLATKDDYVALQGTQTIEARARQNVWLEFGYFWAKLGTSRTLLLVEEGIAVPTNIGNYYIQFRDNLASKRNEIIKQITNLTGLPASNLTEILYLNNDSNQLTRDWRELHELAHHNLVITGISFGNMRQDLPALINKVVANDELTITILAMDPYFIVRNEKLFRSLHGINAVNDNLDFFIAFQDAVKNTVKRKIYDAVVSKRLVLRTFSGYFSGATVYCLDSFNSQHMIFQPFIYKARDRSYDYVRFRLKKRAVNGAFDSIYSSLQIQIEKSKKLEMSYDENKFLKSIRRMLRERI